MLRRKTKQLTLFFNMKQRIRTFGLNPLLYFLYVLLCFINFGLIFNALSCGNALIERVLDLFKLGNIVRRVNKALGRIVAGHNDFKIFGRVRYKLENDRLRQHVLINHIKNLVKNYHVVAA